jgi:alkylated DNA nucleotide flippase Atl1
MALLASIQNLHVGMTLREIAVQSGLTWHRINRIRLGTSTCKYPEQVALEAMLPNETVAKLHGRYYTINVISNFWDTHLKGIKS